MMKMDTRANVSAVVEGMEKNDELSAEGVRLRSDRFPCGLLAAADSDRRTRALRQEIDRLHFPVRVATTSKSASRLRSSAKRHSNSALRCIKAQRAKLKAKRKT